MNGYEIPSAMNSRFAKERFHQLIESADHSLAALSPLEGLDLMLHFYRNERAEHCEIEEDGDMLLYQWGCYDRGKGECFEFNITRQFIEGGGEDENIPQLSLTFTFEVNAWLRKIGDGNRWCSTPDGLDEFRSFIDVSPAFKAVAKLQPAKVTLEFSVAG